MLNIDDKDIALTRGDYAALVFCAYEEEDTLFELSAGDKVQMQICKKYGTPLRTLVKEKETDDTTTDTDYTIEVLPDTTKGLKFGDYYYDVSIVTSDGLPYTYIGDDGENQPKFTVLKEAGGTDE